MKDSKIEWTTHTFNAWEGCTKVSPGCANCYAEERIRPAKRSDIQRGAILWYIRTKAEGGSYWLMVQKPSKVPGKYITETGLTTSFKDAYVEIK